MHKGRDAPAPTTRALSLVASCVLLLTISGSAVGAPRKVDRAKEVAQKVYAQGVDHYRAGRLLEALAAFRASYDTVPSPNSHLMVARALRDRGAIAEAFVEYGKLTVEADAAAMHDPKYEATARASRDERSKLRQRLTLITVQVNEPPQDLRVTLGNQIVERAHWGEPVPVLSGTVVARATASGRPEQQQDLLAMPGSELAVSFDFSAPVPPPEAGPSVAVAPQLPPAPETRRPPSDAIPDIPPAPPRKPAPPPDRTWAYVSFGAGAAGLATFVAFGAMNQSIYNSIEAKCPGGHCSPGLASDVDKGRRAQTIANIGFGVALVGATVGCILLVNGAPTDTRGEEVAHRRPPNRWQGVAVTDVSIGPQAVQVGGEF